jgi:hypothetical protein
VSVPDGLRRTAPWLLCLISLGLYSLSGSLWWLLRNQPSAEDIAWLEWGANALGFVGIPVVGAVIASRLPANPYGWLWCATGLAIAVFEIADPLRRTVGWAAWAAWVLEAWSFISGICLMVFLFLLFPTGRLPTRRWRWIARAAVTSALLMVTIVPFFPADPAQPPPWAVHGTAVLFVGDALLAGLIAMLALVATGMASLVLRFRRAGPVERRQLTWFLYATALIASYLVLDALDVRPSGWVNALVNAVTLAALPAAVGIAVLRYRLFEIDRIVSRTVSYGLLSAVLIGVYLLVVALLRPLLEPLTGTSTLAVAGSTLAVAAAFHPARRRLQAAVDRRFDRARYDAGRAVEAFAARLRDQVDLDEIATGLRATVGATVAPDRMAVWLRPADRR